MTVSQGHKPAALAEMSKAAPQPPEPARKCAVMSLLCLQINCVATRTCEQPLNADCDSMDTNREGVERFSGRERERERDPSGGALLD